MNEAKFTELVNLYFDHELSPRELEWLRDELAANPDRRREFEARYRLNQGMRVALAADALKDEQLRARAARKTFHAAGLAAWVVGSGIAACVTLGVLVLRPALQEQGSAAGADAFAEVARADMDHFAAARAAGDARHGSLVAELRLMGLTPEMVPVERQLHTVDVEALRQREARRQRVIEGINQYQAYSAMPETPVLESLPQPMQRRSPAQRWPAGFHSSLASF
jgi:hypothetical protein